MTEPLLNLDTLIVRPVVVIDGARYEILNADELSVLDSHRMGVWGRRIDALSASDDAGDAAELAKLYDQLARAVLVGVPDDVFAKLSGAQQIAVADVFSGLLMRNKLGVAGAMATAMGTGQGLADLLTGASGLPGSSASTAGRRNGGWRKRLARWFGLI